MNIPEIHRSESQFVSVGDSLLPLMSKIQSEGLVSVDMESKVPTGFQDLDKLLVGGFPKRQLSLLYGESGVGKTSLALNIAIEAVTHYCLKVGIFSLDMNLESLLVRMLSMYSGVNWNSLYYRRITNIEESRIQQAVSRLQEARLKIMAPMHIRLEEILRQTTALVINEDLDLVVIDRMERIRKLPTETYAEIASGVRYLADHTNTAVLGLCTSKVKAYEPETDVMMKLFREDQHDRYTEKKGIADIFITKNRGGPVGQVSLLFNSTTGRFLDLEVDTG